MSRKQQRTSYNCALKNVLNFLCRVTRTNDRTAERQNGRTTERPNDRTAERRKGRTTEGPNDRMAERQRQRPSMNSAHYLIKRLPARVVWERDNPAWLHSGIASFPGRSRLQFSIASSIKTEGEGLGERVTCVTSGRREGGGARSL